MNRRKFISISSISIVGTNSLVMSVSSFLGLGSEDKIFDILSFIGVHKTGKIDVLKNNSIIFDTLKSWAKSNYSVCDENVYWEAGDNQILIPIQLKTSDDVIIDNIVLVFNLEKADNIRYVGNLTSFHIEAISRNKKILSKLGNIDKIRESVLPSSGKGKPVDLGWSFETKLGSFELSASLNEGKTSVSSALYADNNALWQSSFLSETSLIIDYTTTM
jgi:hypothetical protein